MSALEVVDALLDRTGEVARTYFHGGVEGLAAQDKGAAGNPGGYDPVTVADREIERILSAGLLEAFPGDRVSGEEFGVRGAAGATRTWSLDPIDGTKAFLTGMLGWGTLVGLVESGGGDERVVAGWMDQPVLRERYSGVDGRAVLRRDGREYPLAVSGCTALGDAVLYTTHPSMFDGPRAESYARLGRSVRLQRFGGDCYAYCQLAAGRVDLVVESQLNAYDICALIPIVEAAGGVVTGPDGRQPVRGGTVVAAATAELAAAAWELLGRQ